MRLTMKERGIVTKGLAGQSTMKLIEKVRTGSHVKKRYDHPKTPYQLGGFCLDRG